MEKANLVSSKGQTSEESSVAVNERLPEWRKVSAEGDDGDRLKEKGSWKGE